MADLTITTEQLTRLYPVYQAMGALTLPTANGRYVVIRASEKVEAAIKPVAIAESELTQRCQVPGSARTLPNGQQAFTVKPELAEEHATQRAALLAEPVTLSGVRALTRAELGECPITVAMDRALVECHLLEPMPDEPVP